MTLFPFEMKTLASTPVSAGGLAVFLILSSTLLLFSWFGSIDFTGEELNAFISTDHSSSRSILHTNSTTKSRSGEDSDAGFVDAVSPGAKSRPENTTGNTKWPPPNMDPGCDLYQGEWVYDSRGPLYNNSCPVMIQTQNCRGNGRPDRNYEYWRWKPTHCDLPRFDARSFLDLMAGKTLAFVGDSIARNQMESLLCLLWQVEVPILRNNQRIPGYYFASTSTTIVRIWSSWLLHKTTEKSDFAPPNLDKLHLDIPDETFMDFIPEFDVTVISSGHWFTKKSAYLLKNEIVGSQLLPKESTLSQTMRISNIEAFGISVETVLSAMVTNPNYTGLTVVRTFSPDHYEGGKWNTGGSCTGKVDPAKNVVENLWTNAMHSQQIGGFSRALKKMSNKSRLKLMDITEAFGYRHDGHPGPYRSTDPNKITKRGPDGKPPPQDCLHWCMPGPVDTWNEILFEVIRRDADNTRGVSSS